MLRADTLDDAARELARKVSAAVAPREAITLTLRNLSSLSAADVTAVRRALEAELQSRGLLLVEESAPHKEIRVTLAENLGGYLWVAEIPRDAAPQVEMVSVSKPSASVAGPRPPELVLEKKLIWEQEEPILDFALLDASSGPGPGMLVLEPAKVSLYRREHDRWELRGSYPVPATKPWPRDLRGRIALRDHAFQAYLPGLDCEGDTRRTSNWKCQEGAARWPLGALDAAGFGIVPARNFFSSRAREGAGGPSKLPAFFSAAVVETLSETLWVVAGTDGRARLFGQESEAGQKRDVVEGIFLGWGSDLASVRSECGHRWQVFVTRPVDWTENDAVMPYEVVDRQAVAVGSPVVFPGPVTALWPGANFQHVIAVVRNLKTGHYEAYQLSISCGR